MKAKKWQYGTLGSISSGTMRPQDLIPDFVYTLRYLGHRSKELTRIERRMNSTKYYETEDSMWDLESLFDMLQEHAPDYVYFGSHPGDGSDYGFWVSDFVDDDFEDLKVSDLADIPSDYIGHVLVINDHGNMTLYYKSARKLTELWSAV